MAHGLDDRSEFEQIISQARYRWLRPAEICDILRNPTRLGLSDKRANLPASGSLFLYDRNVLRHFRNDGHRWKKTKNRGAVKEGHERLKVEGDEVLHCYYAHGEKNENFQRRSYSTIEQDLSHIVLVHYREVKSNRTNFNDVEKIEEVVPHSNETEELAPNPEMQNSISSSFNPSNLQMHAQATDTTSLKTAQASEFKNAESGACWQTSEGTLSCSFNSPMDQSLHSNREYDVTTSFHEEVDAADLFKSMGPCHMDSDIQNDYSTQTNNDTISKRNNTIEGKADHPSVLKPQSDNQQIFLQAKHDGWLRPAEIYEILQNYKKFHISSEPANIPPGGSLFLFNRKVQKHFRRDGHNWKKKKDGKTVAEGNEKLKVRGVNVLHCYYTRGEEDENFHRRSYQMLDKDLSHIALVHYREVKRQDLNSTIILLKVHELNAKPESPIHGLGSYAQGHNRTNFNNVKEAVPYSNEAEEIARQPELKNSVSSIFNPSNYQMRLQATDSTSLSNAKASEFEDVESGACAPYVKMETKRYGLGNQLDIQQILLEAKHRWLRPAEICEILKNYKKFHISSEPATTPPGGSLFLFDRKVLRYFRKDGHNWRKKKDGKTVKEAHERLKAGNVDVLHCYYAHGEENENFQRRSYWMLEEDLSHIVLVQYREVKGNRTNFNHVKETVPYSNDAEEIARHSEMDYQMHSQATDATSLSSAQASEFEDVESAFYNQASSGLQPMTEKINTEFSDAYYPMPFSNGYQEKLSTIPGVDFSTLTQPYKRLDSNDAGVTDVPRKNREFTLGDEVESSATGLQFFSFQQSFSATQSDTMGNFSKQENETHGNLFTDSLDKRLVYGIENEPKVQQNWQTSEGSSNWLMDRSITTKFPEGVDATDLLKSLGPFLMDSDEQNDLQFHLSNADTISKRNDSIEGKADHAPAIRPLLDGSFGDGLKKRDSFNRWMSKELEDVDELQMQSSSGAYWDTVESENEVDESSVPLQVRLDSYMLGPSLSHDQLFSIVDFSPNWAYENSEIKVLITGRFLKGQHAESCKWSCMFGEVEVPAEVIADGVLRCYSPVHKAGRLPFYVTCSNRLACSEVREFEYRVAKTQDIDSKDYYSDCSNETLNMRFGKLLSLSSTSPNCDPISIAENSEVSSKISSLLKNDNDEWDKMLQLTSDEDFSLERVEEQFLEQLLKEKLHAWLLEKLAGGGKGPSVLDEGGQGVLHFGAALGYDWVLLPSITAGVSVNFHDVNGWTALHWAAFCGRVIVGRRSPMRERTVASLISLGAAPGALTDPTTKYPSGETPADLASEQGHKGIAGYLAESALSAHLSSLNLDIKEGNSAEISGGKAVSASSRDGELTDGLSLRDSLTAVCNATQAAARIHQVFGVQSFQRKQQLKEFDGDKFGISNEGAPSLSTVKSHKAGKCDEHVGAAAILIQTKFRSWRARKDFLIIQQRIVKIQAHVRGHQVRKNYRKIVWSVGIVEKIILRWRRKGSGLRGFKPEPLPEGPSMQISSSKDDDYDVLKEGRKQTEERLQKALARVKSMVQYPEARDQYHRLLNVVTEIQETKVLNSSEGTSAYMDGDLIDVEALLDEDIFMPTKKLTEGISDELAVQPVPERMEGISLRDSSTAVRRKPRGLLVQKGGRRIWTRTDRR